MVTMSWEGGTATLLDATASSMVLGILMTGAKSVVQVDLTGLLLKNSAGDVHDQC